MGGADAQACCAILQLIHLCIHPANRSFIFRHIPSIHTHPFHTIPVILLGTQVVALNQQGNKAREEDLSRPFEERFRVVCQTREQAPLT